MDTVMDDSIRRDQWLGTLFSTWVVVGLFLDGWAHNAGKPEDFFTPYHAVLYSGLVVGALVYARERHRRRREGLGVDTDRWMLLGFGFFAVAGVGDMIWHTVFGVEEDVAALLSPTHLALMVGGLLLVTGPIRRARQLPDVAVRWRTFLPVLVAAVLAVSVVAFFLQFLSAFHVHELEAAAGGGAGGSLEPLHGVASVLVTNVLLIGGMAWLLARWPRPPVGTVTAYLTSIALLLSSLLAFEQVVLVGSALAAGVVGDVVLHRGARRTILLVAVPAVLWSVWFAVFASVWGLGWEVEIWTGTIVFAVLTGVGFEVVLGAAAHEATAASVPPAQAPTEVGGPASSRPPTRPETMVVEAGVSE